MASDAKFITSSANADFKRLRGLTANARQVKRSGQTLIEGVHLIQACLDARYAISELVLAEGAGCHPEVKRLLNRLAGIPGITLAASLFAELTGVVSPVGIAAVIPVPVSATAAPLPPISADAIALDGIQDAGNLGTILRTAAAVGISQAILGKGCAGAWSNKVVRAGQGAHFQISIVEDVELIEWAAVQKLPLVGTVLKSSMTIYSAPLHGPVIWVFGSEGKGVSPALMERLTMCVAIPMAQGVESLNVGAAAAICLYEMYRQRYESSLR